MSRPLKDEAWWAVKREAWRRYDERHPDRHAVQGAVSKAIRRGDLVRQPCEWCGAVKVEADHFYGYEPANLLRVRWLCRRHHLCCHGYRLAVGRGAYGLS